MFQFTPDEAQSTALAVIEHLRSEKHNVVVEEGVDPSVGFRPTMTGTLGVLKTYVEAQSTPLFSRGLRDLVSWASVQRTYSEIFIAAPTSADAGLGFLKEIKRDGVGLILVDDNGAVDVHLHARNPALMVALNSTLALGSRAKAVKDQVARFNASDRKGALQSMCEIVEFETDKLVTKLARKGLISKTEGEVAKMDWATQINISASQTVHISGNPLVSESLKTDLHSFRGARNLINHKVSSKRDEQKREQQFAERMLMGPRLTADLLSLQRKAK